MESFPGVLYIVSTAVPVGADTHDITPAVVLAKTYPLEAGYAVGRVYATSPACVPTLKEV